jgi:hypothetical protein
VSKATFVLFASIADKLDKSAAYIAMTQGQFFEITPT